MANNVKALRLSKSISLENLADRVGAPPGLIHKVESNRRLAEINLAKAICLALGRPIEWVFPGSKEALATLDEELAGPTHVSQETFAGLRKVGLEGDTRQYTLKVLLRGHEDPLFYSFAPNELDRLFEAVQQEEAIDSGLSFIVFDSEYVRVAINLRSMIFCHFLWDLGSYKLIRTEPDEPIEDDEGPDQTVHVFFGENPTPVTISAEAEDGPDLESDQSYLNFIFCALDGSCEPQERLQIVDEDGESAFLRAGDIALLTAPLWVLDSSELDVLRLDDEED
jgi:transcriptional regulator with XRE-family HTH domain